jgi:hypothetical protein
MQKEAEPPAQRTAEAKPRQIALPRLRLFLHSKMQRGGKKLLAQKKDFVNSL